MLTVWCVTEEAAPSREVDTFFMASGLAFAPDGTLYLGTLNHRILLYDAATLEERAYLEAETTVRRVGVGDMPAAQNGAPLAFAFSPDGALLYSLSNDDTDPRGNELRIWDVARRALDTAPIPLPDLPEGGALTADGRFLLVGYTGGALQVWDVDPRR